MFVRFSQCFLFFWWFLSHVQGGFFNCSALKCQILRKFWHFDGNFFDGIYYVIWHLQFFREEQLPKKHPVYCITEPKVWAVCVSPDSIHKSVFWWQLKISHPIDLCIIHVFGYTYVQYAWGAPVDLMLPLSEWVIHGKLSNSLWRFGMGQCRIRRRKKCTQQIGHKIR